MCCLIRHSRAPGNRTGTGRAGTGRRCGTTRRPGGRYPLAVKLGTITPHGADVYSYAADED